MNSAVLLYTMRCNISCAHCSVDSHPKRQEKMELDTALELVRGLCRLSELEFIDISGGEPMLYKKEIVMLAREARRGGKAMRIVSNGFWAVTPERAAEVLGEMTRAGVSSVGISIDEWHLPFFPPIRVSHYISGCRQVGFVPLLSCVTPEGLEPLPNFEIPEYVKSLLARYGLEYEKFVDVYDWGERRKRYSNCAAEFDREFGQTHVLINWQPLTSEGRARDLKVAEVRFSDSAEEPCRMAGHLPTIDEQGRLFPCCSPWTSRKTHALARINGVTVPDAVRQTQADPLVQVMHRFGPKRLIDAARAEGVLFPESHSGICNQCGMLMDRLTLPQMEVLAGVVLERVRRQECIEALGLRERVPGA